ncbi:MAG TPA: hypothetical protein VGO60_14545 [Iamia sp.]|jgi:hypothetical protein|nr:hypothetical protein [Iamia sp.]
MALTTDASEAVDAPEPAARRSGVRGLLDRPLVVGIGLHLLVSLPLVVALVAFNRPQWHPIADLAQTELRVRDVGTRHSPLVGLAGRIGPWYDPGSHPGPLSFWALAPVYRLLGGSALALSASAAALHSLALGLALWIARRRGGVRVMLAVGAAAVVLVHAYGAVVFLEPWNPYLPVTWWLVLLLAAWSVLDDDSPMLVVAVAAGSFCAQTHLPYLGLVGGIGGGLALASGWWIWRGRPDDEPGARARRIRYLVAAVVVGLVLWTPPVIDEVNGVGNLTRVKDSLSHPEGEPVGVVQGAKEVVQRYGLDQWSGALDVSAPPEPSAWNLGGLLVLAAWLVAAARSGLGRVGPPTLRRLHAVLGLGLVLGLVAASRIHGELWYYLYLWVTGLAALTAVAVGWTVAAEVQARTGPVGRRRLRTAVVAVPLVVAGAASAAFATTAPSAEPSRPDLSNDLGVLADETVAALRSDDIRGGGTDGHYLVRWEDPVTIGSQGFGLVNELERAGFDAGVEVGHRVGGTRHRAMTPDEATAVLVLAVGPAIEAWDARPDDQATPVAHVDRRTDADRREAEVLATRIDAALLAAGLDDQAASWRQTVFTAALDPQVPQAIRDDLLRYLDLGAPVTVFVVDPALIPA